MKTLQESLHVILNIQELDINMIRLMRIKKERQKELSKVQALKIDIEKQVANKDQQILELKKEARLGEIQIKEIQEKVARLETQQAAVKKMDEFNALTQEMTSAGRERHAVEQRLSDLTDKLANEEDLLVALKANLQSTESNSIAIENEIREGIEKINEEGQSLLKQREALQDQVDPEIFKIYERLLKNKRDRVVVPIEHRTCSGCHIVLTPQHENFVRKGDRLVFCEHCSRVLIWQEMPAAQESGEATTTRRRRRRTLSPATSQS